MSEKFLARRNQGRSVLSQLRFSHRYFGRWLIQRLQPLLYLVRFRWASHHSLNSGHHLFRHAVLGLRFFCKMWMTTHKIGRKIACVRCGKQHRPQWRRWNKLNAINGRKQDLNATLVGCLVRTTKRICNDDLSASLEAMKSGYGRKVTWTKHSHDAPHLSGKVNHYSSRRVESRATTSPTCGINPTEWSGHSNVRIAEQDNPTSGNN